MADQTQAPAPPQVFTEIVDKKAIRELAQSGAKIHAILGTGWRSAETWTSRSLPEWSVMYSLPESQSGGE